MRVYEAQKGESHTKQSAILTTASLLTILFMTLHLTGDILFRMAPAGLGNLFVVFVFVIQLCGTLVLGGRRAGYIIIFLGSVLGLVIPVVHMKGYQWRHRQLRLSFPFRMDNPRVGNHLDVLRNSIGERIVEFAVAPEPPHVNCRTTPDCGINVFLYRRVKTTWQ